MRRAMVWPVLLLSWTLATSSAAAQTAQPLLEERALGLGGAVTASARGPTAAYYNPAGLATTGQTAVGASLSLRSFRDYRVDDAYVSRLGIEDLQDSGLQSIPVFLGGAIAFGDRDRRGIEQHALAAGTLLRSFRDRSFVQSQVAPGSASTLEIVEERADRWYFLSYGVRPLPELGLGLTVAVSTQSQTYLESRSEGLGLDDASLSSLTARDVQIDLNEEALVVRGGVQALPLPWLQLGLTVQSPSIPVAGGGDATFQRLTVDGPDSSLFRRRYEELDPSLQTPWQLRGGAYVRALPSWGVGLDVGVTGRVGRPNDPVRPLGREVPRDGARPASTYFPEERESGFGFDVALGSEVIVEDVVPVRAGIFFEHDAARRLDAPADRFAPDQLDRIGASIAVGVHGERYDFSVGVAYVHGFGSAYRPDPTGPSFYVPTDARSHELTFVLSGVTSAAAELALDAYHEINGDGADEDDPDAHGDGEDDEDDTDAHDDDDLDDDAHDTDAHGDGDLDEGGPLARRSEPRAPWSQTIAHRGDPPRAPDAGRAARATERPVLSTRA